MTRESDRAATPTNAAISAAAGAGAKRRVLLVDDDVDFLDIHRIALEGAGYEVAIAHDAPEAMLAATSAPFDVAVLDVIMHGPHDGFELARALRRDPRTRHTQLIMLTSINAVNEARGIFFRFGDQDRDDHFLPVDRFIDKPVAHDALVRLVSELVV